MFPLILILVAAGAGAAYWKWGRHPSPAPSPIPPRDNTHPLLTVVPTNPQPVLEVEEVHDPDWVVAIPSMFFEHPDVRSESIRAAEPGEVLYQSGLDVPKEGWIPITLEYGILGWIGEQYVRPFQKIRAIGASAFYPGG